MPSSFGSVCYPSVADASSAACAEYPKLTAALDGTPLTVSCTGSSATGVLTLKSAAALVSSGAASGQWLQMGSSGGEGVSFSFVSAQTVRYGAGASYNQKTVSGNFTCNAANFGDPAPGVGKHCDLFQSGDSYAATKTVALAFPVCDPSAKYNDLYAVFLLCLGALAALWAVKSFTLKLLANQ